MKTKAASAPDQAIRARSPEKSGRATGSSPLYGPVARSGPLKPNPSQAESQISACGESVSVVRAPTSCRSRPDWNGMSTATSVSPIRTP